MQLRNFFRRNDSLHSTIDNDEGFSAVKVSGLDPKEPVAAAASEYQLDKIADDGNFVSPKLLVAKSGFWHSIASTKSSSSSARRSVLSNDNEPFNMSRESFDSYRRSFDISTRSPVVDHFQPNTRHSIEHSIDSDAFLSATDLEYHLRSRWPNESHMERHGAFEDVALHETATDAADVDSASRRRGSFPLRFGDAGAQRNTTDVESTEERSASGGGVLGFSLFSSRNKAATAEVDEFEEMSDLSRPSSSSSAESEW